MAQQYIYAVSSIKYGTPTGLATMPTTLSTLPDTVKGTINIEETEGSFTRFYVDQKKDPIRSVKTEEGEFSMTAQFYDLNPYHLAALKGGTAVTGGTESFTPSVSYTDVNWAVEVTFSSGHKLEIYNGAFSTRMLGTGGREDMIKYEVKVTPQLAANGLGTYKLTTV